MKLTNKEVKAAEAAEKTYTIPDGGSLYLEVPPKGNKGWRYKYRIRGKQKRLSLGTYPKVSLREARKARDQAKRLLGSGIDPADRKRAEKIAQADNGFEKVTREYFQKQTEKLSADYIKREMRSMERDVFPWIGDIDVEDIEPYDVLTTVRRIEERGAYETAHRVLSRCGRIFRYSIASQYCRHNPARDLSAALVPSITKHYGAIVEPERISGLLRAINSYRGFYPTRCALKMAPYVFVRPGELRRAEWSEFDIDAVMADTDADWRIPAEKMKMKVAHIVPLASQVREILRQLHPLTGGDKYLFPSIRSNGRPMSDNTINASLRRLGYTKEEMTGHGFRAMARTVIDEELQIRPDYIEQQLAHAVRDPLGRAYNRTKHLGARRNMMQQWADYLDNLRDGE